MIRTQVYITAQEKKALVQIAQYTGHSQSELIRKAIDLLLSQSQLSNRIHLLRSAKGLWKNNQTNFTSFRKEMDRNFNN